MMTERELFECSKCKINLNSFKELDAHIKLNHSAFKSSKFEKKKEKTCVELVNKRAFKIEDSSRKEHPNNFSNIDKAQTDLVESETKLSHQKPSVEFISFDLIKKDNMYLKHEDIDEIDLSYQNLFQFKDGKIPFFELLQNLLVLNLSHNILTNIDDVQRISSIRFLDISFNKIYELNCIDSLKNLEVIKANNNSISYISCLVTLRNLRVLEIHKNTISYKMSTMKTLANLISLKELCIADNPFLKEFEGYKHIFIHKFKKLIKLDSLEITENQRILSEKYVNKYYEEKGYVAENRPISADNNSNYDDNVKQKESEMLIDEIGKNCQKENKSANNFFKRILYKNLKDTTDKEYNPNDTNKKNKIYDEVKFPSNSLISKNCKLSFKISKKLLNFPHNEEILNKQENQGFSRENEILKEEIEYYKLKLKSSERLIDCQKEQIDVLKSISSNPNCIEKDVDMIQIKHDLKELFFSIYSLREENENLYNSILEKEIKSKGILSPHSINKNIKVKNEIDKFNHNTNAAFMVKYDFECLKNDIKQLKLLTSKEILINKVSNPVNEGDHQSKSKIK